MARNVFGVLAKNKPVWVSLKTKDIPGANCLMRWIGVSQIVSVLCVCLFICLPLCDYWVC